MSDRNPTPRFVWTLLAFLAFLAPSTASAFDHLEVTVISPEIVQGRPSVTVYEDFDIYVRAVNLDGSTDTSADFINAVLTSPDVPAVLPAAAYLTSGEYTFTNLSFLADGQPVRIRVADQDDGSVPFAEVAMNCYDIPKDFVITVPAGPKSVGDLINLTVTARNAALSPVANFDDDVVLTPAIGHFTAGPTVTVPGTSFVLGVATIGVVFQGTDTALNQNTVTARNTVVYPTQALPASGSALVAPLDPGALSRVVLLLPGESLTPGVSPGKSGAPIAQISGFPFNGMDVYATDAYWNPVDAGPYPALAWSSDDGAGGVVLPAGGLMASNAVLDQAATLMTSGLREVTVNATGAINASSSSNVQVNPAGLDHFEFDYAVFDTTEIRATTTPFQIRVRAYDSFGNLFSYNGPVSMRVKIGAVDESADYLITSSNIFVNGVLNANVQVTKRAFSVVLIVDSNTGVIEESGDFQVNAGPMEKVLFTLPGQTWAPGLNDPMFGGNLGLPNDITAGQMIDPLEIRAVDRYGNLVSGLRTVSISCPTGHMMLISSGGTLIESGVISLNGTGIYRALVSTAGEQTIMAAVGGQSNSYSAPIDVSPNIYQRLIMVAPGESLDSGSLSLPGKIGTPAAQDAGAPFEVHVFATDAYFNPIDVSSTVLPLDFDFSCTDIQAVLPVGTQSLLSNSASFPVTLLTLADPPEQLVRVDEVGSSVSGSALIPLEAGVIDHFDVGVDNATNPDPSDVLDPIPDLQAGSWLPNVTVVARDAFGNHIASFTDSVSLSLNVSGDVISPVRISLANGYGSGGFQGVWRGSLRITRAGNGITVVASDDIYGRTGVSAPFDVFPGPYDDLLVLLPGETATPGESPGKFGVPLPQSAGDVIATRVEAVDAWWNRVADTPTVHIGTSGYTDIVSVNNVALDAGGYRDVDVRFRTAEFQDLWAVDMADAAHTDSSTVEIIPGEFVRLQTIAPGETPLPGGPEVDGKTGSPDAQTATLQFPVTVRAVDQYWNQVDESAHNVFINSDEGSLGPGNPLNNGQTLANGEIVFPLALSSLGYATLTANDTTDPSILGHEVVVLVEAGAQYRITTPDTAYVGPPSTFSMTLELVDEWGTVMTNAFNDVTLRALTPTLQPASGVLLDTDATLVAGTVTLNAQAYNVASQIVIEVSDASGRGGFSNVIRMLPNGLIYDVSVGGGSALVAGPPAVFPVTVRLLDTATGSLVDDDRFFDLAVVLADGTPGGGAVGVVEQRLIDGEVTFNQSWTQAGQFALRVSDDTGLWADSPLFMVEPDGYKRIQTLAPGETAHPGEFAFASTGKSGVPDPQRSGEPFTVQLRAVDQFWNPVDTIDGGRLHLATTDDAFDFPANPAEQDVPFVSGMRSMELFLTATGSVGVTVSDLDAPGLPGQTVHIDTEAPYVYEIDVPVTAQTGPLPGFPVVIRLVDPDTGDLVADAYNRVVLRPLQGDYDPGNGALGTDEVYLVGGVSVITDQSYSSLENLVIHAADDFGRQAFSNLIVMETGGLYYSISAPVEAVVGTPSTFPLEIELIDSNTGDRVVSHTGLVSIAVFAAGTGQPGTGVLGTIQQTLVGGYALVEQTYTRAEDIYFVVADADENTGVSNTCRMLADGFKQVMIIAPGETLAPGSGSGTGKAGVPLVQASGEPFLVELRAVDQFWNTLTDYDAGAVEIESSVPAEFAWQNNDDYHSSFVGGRRQVGVVLDGAGNITLTASDGQAPAAMAGQVTVPVIDAVYEVTVPDTVFVGPPNTFTVAVRLTNPDTGETVPAGNRIQLEALRFDHGPATAALSVGSWTLLQGEAAIATMSYGVSEDIVIRVTDDRGRETVSDVITVIPVGVTYSIVAPDTVVAGESWSLEIRRVDVITGRLVTGYDETFDLEAVNAWSGDSRPDPLLSPSGILRYTYGTTVDGSVLLADQAYDRAESIYLRVTDENGGDVLSHLITVRAAEAFVFDLELLELDGSAMDRVLRPDQQIRARISARDVGGNPAPGARAVFTVHTGDATLAAVRAETIELVTGAGGVAQTTLRIDEYGERDVLFGVTVDALEPEQALLRVAGPPTTSTDFSGVASAYLDGWYVSFDTVIDLVAVAGVPEEGTTVWYDVDHGDGVLPLTAFSDPVTLAALGVDEPGSHVLRFFAEEESGVREAMREVVLYTTRALTSDKPITNRPNPFHAGREETKILFNPPAGGTVNITIYDLYGTVVLTHHMDAVANQTNEFIWDGRNGNQDVVANGGYICRVTGTGFDLRRKIAVVK